jgi:hypothetical protein
MVATLMDLPIYLRSTRRPAKFARVASSIGSRVRPEKLVLGRIVNWPSGTSQRGAVTTRSGTAPTGTVSRTATQRAPA